MVTRLPKTVETAGEIEMRFWTVVFSILQSLFTCSHARALGVEGKTYCPDCGKGVIFRWVVHRCVGCHQRRPTRYLFRNVVPLHQCCTFCGEEASERVYLSEPEFFQLRHALLSYEVERHEASLLSEIRINLSHYVVNLSGVMTSCPSSTPLLSARISH